MCTAVAPWTQEDVKLSLFELTLFNKQLLGTIFGSGSPRAAIPQLLKRYQDGKLKLDELITKRYKLDDINDGYQDMRDGKNIRGVIDFGVTSPSFWALTCVSLPQPVPSDWSIAPLGPQPKAE